jgi:hypothetical protein
MMKVYDQDNRILACNRLGHARMSEDEMAAISNESRVVVG